MYNPRSDGRTPIQQLPPMYDPRNDGRTDGRTPIQPLPPPVQSPPLQRAPKPPPVLNPRQKKRATWLVLGLLAVFGLYGLSTGGITGVFLLALVACLVAVPWILKRLRADVERWKGWFR